MAKSIKIPLHALIVMVGPSGGGKSTMISQYFKSYEIVSSDSIREELTGDFRNQHHNDIVFKEFHRRIELKLSIGERVVADATHLRKKDRIATAQLGAKYHIPVYYIIINRTIEDKITTAGWRTGVPGLIEKHEETFKSQLPDILKGDSMATVIDLRITEFNSDGDPDDEITVVQKINFDNLQSNLQGECGYSGITVVGDVHGMARDFQEKIDKALEKNHIILSLGDIVDYGPDSAQTIDTMYHLVVYGHGIMIIGNHERKLEKYILQNRAGHVKVKITGGIKATVDQFNSLDPFKCKMVEDRFLFLMNYSRHHVILNDQYLFVHASATSKMWNMTQNRLVGLHEQRAVFGQVDDIAPFRDDGFPNRIYDWVDEIPKGKTVIVGHAVRCDTEIIEQVGLQGGKAIFLDTGSAKGGFLSVYEIDF